MQFKQSKQAQGQQNVQEQQLYSQQMGMPGYSQPGIQVQGQTQGQTRGQVPFSQIEQAQLPHLPSPLQPQPVSKVTAGQDQDTDKGQSPQVLSEGQGQTAMSSNVPPIQQIQSKQDLDKELTGPTWPQGTQQAQNVPTWSPLNLNVPQEPTVTGVGSYQGHGKAGSVPGTPVQGKDVVFFFLNKI